MARTFSREEILRHLIPLMHDPKSAAALQEMSDEQLQVVAETLDDLSKWKPERRNEIRKAIMRRVLVGPAEGTAFRNQYGFQEDISEHGIGIFLNRAIPVGTRIKISLDGRDSLGTVRRCRQDKGGWAIGVLLDQPASSTGATQPEATDATEPAAAAEATAATAVAEATAAAEPTVATAAAGDSVPPSESPQVEASQPEQA
jgi:PilZ domain